MFGKFVGGIVESTSTRFSGLSEQRIGLPAKENFQRFGLVERKRSTAERIKKGDLLILYVGGRACLSDIRRVRSPSLIALRHGEPYETSFSFAMSSQRQRRNGCQSLAWSLS